MKIPNILDLFTQWAQGISSSLGDVSSFCRSRSASVLTARWALENWENRAPPCPADCNAPDTQAAAATSWQLTRPVQPDDPSTLKDQCKVPNCVSTNARTPCLGGSRGRILSVAHTLLSVLSCCPSASKNRMYVLRPLECQGKEISAIFTLLEPRLRGNVRLRNSRAHWKSR